MEIKQFHVKNQFLLNNNDEVYFQSYESMIAHINDKGVLTFGKNWNYSKTTSKYLYKFLDEYRYKITNFDIKGKILDMLNSTNKAIKLQKLVDKKLILIKENKE